MQIQNGAHVPTGSACPNKAKRYLFALAPAGADLVLLTAIEVLLWMV
jgi:hypothetical protein